jgi:anti-sigma regulatory factor (Ser/Thr protein kinase)
MIDWLQNMSATLLSTAAAWGPGVDRRGRFGLMAHRSLLGSVTIPGRPELVSGVRAAVAGLLGRECPATSTAVLLVSELVTNSIQHSRSRRNGGIVAVTLIALANGIRAEVHDEGSVTVPTLRSEPPDGAGLSGDPSCGLPDLPDVPDLDESGRGLQLVDTLAARWGYCRDAMSAVTWFELTDAAVQA